MKEHNVFQKEDAVSKAGRDISEKRASTIAYMIEEAKKAGISDNFARKAIYAYGKDAALKLKAMMKDPTDMLEYAEYFGTDHNNEILEMERIEVSEDKLYIDFHYCPYVKKWKEMGYSIEEMANLCDITMEGDRAYGDTFEAFEFRLGDTIAKGFDICQIRFDKKK
jgi:DNA-binding transcriptional regulator YhcF (GntR family)